MTLGWIIKFLKVAFLSVLGSCGLPSQIERVDELGSGVESLSRIDAEVLFEHSIKVEQRLLCNVPTSYQNVTIILSVGLPLGSSSTERMQGALKEFLEFHYRAKECTGQPAIRQLDALVFGAECNESHILIATVPTNDFCDVASRGLSEFE